MSERLFPPNTRTTPKLPNLRGLAGSQRSLPFCQCICGLWPELCYLLGPGNPPQKKATPKCKISLGPNRPTKFRQSLKMQVKVRESEQKISNKPPKYKIISHFLDSKPSISLKKNASPPCFIEKEAFFCLPMSFNRVRVASIVQNWKHILPKF